MRSRVCLCVCQSAFRRAPNATHNALIHLNAQTNRDLAMPGAASSRSRVWYNIYTWYDKGPSIQWLSLFLFEGGCHIKYDGSFIFWVHTQAERSDSELPGGQATLRARRWPFCRLAEMSTHNSCIGASTLLMNQKMEFIASAAASQNKCFRGTAPRRTSSVCGTNIWQCTRWALKCGNESSCRAHPLLIFAPEQ
jgi:hypothetical protein